MIYGEIQSFFEPKWSPINTSMMPCFLFIIKISQSTVILMSNIIENPHHLRPQPWLPSTVRPEFTATAPASCRHWRVPKIWYDAEAWAKIPLWFRKLKENIILKTDQIVLPVFISDLYMSYQHWFDFENQCETCDKEWLLPSIWFFDIIRVDSCIWQYYKIV